MRLGAFLSLVLVPASLAAQSMELRPDPVEAHVGDVITVTATIHLPRGMEPLDPAPRSLLPLPKGVRILASDTLQPVSEGEYRATIRMGFFRVGAQPIPTLSLLYRPAPGVPPDTLVHLPVSVTITPLLPSAGNPGVKDIRGLRAVAPPAWLAVAGLLATIAAGLWWLRRRAGPPAPAPRIAPARPPEPGAFDQALARLDRLEAEMVASGDGVLPCYGAMAAILRESLATAGAIPHLGFTTAELAHALPAALQVDAGAERCAALLGEADLVKFARVRPDLATARDSLERARTLLRDWRTRSASAIGAPER